MHFFTNLIVLLLLNAYLTRGHPVINADSANYETKKAPRRDYAFIVSIGRKGNKDGSFTQRQGHFCGGALLTRSHVLTASHCLVGEKPKALRVVVGTTNFRKPGVEYHVSSWTTYNEWGGKKDSGIDHDIAVIELTDSVVESYVDTIDIYPRSINTDGLQLETAGWGKTEQYKTSPILLKIPLRFVPLETCELDLSLETNAINYISMQHMCTRSNLKMRLGEGDSGGPLILRENGHTYVVGVNEAYCAGSTSFLNTHARISYYRNFINQATKSRSACSIL